MQTKQKNRGVNEIWADAVVLAAQNASSGAAPKPLCAQLVRMGDLGNVPRQEKKFKVRSIRGVVNKFWLPKKKNDVLRLRITGFVGRWSLRSHAPSRAHAKLSSPPPENRAPENRTL